MGSGDSSYPLLLTTKPTYGPKGSGQLRLECSSMNGAWRGECLALPVRTSWRHGRLISWSRCRVGALSDAFVLPSDSRVQHTCA